MNKLIATAVVATLAFASPVFADDEHHPEQAAASAPVNQAPEQAIRKMQGNLKKMQTQLDQAAKAKNADERHKIMAEYMKSNQENMMMARGMQGGMGGCPMMEGGGMMGKGMMGGGMGMMGGGAQPGGGPDRMQQMEKRMDMMQMMMEQMMRRQEGQSAPMK